MNKQFFCPNIPVFLSQSTTTNSNSRAKVSHCLHFTVIFSIHEMTQPPDAVVKAATDGRVSKGGFLPAGAWFVPVGARIKREYW